jgi:hypothetical protein
MTISKTERVTIPPIALVTYNIDDADRIGIQFKCRYRNELAEALLFYEPSTDRLWRWNPCIADNWEPRPTSDISAKRGAKLQAFWIEHEAAIGILRQQVRAAAGKAERIQMREELSQSAELSA